MERAMRFELTTLTLARLCSTPELRPHFHKGTSWASPAARRHLSHASRHCNRKLLFSTFLFQAIDVLVFFLHANDRKMLVIAIILRNRLCPHQRKTYLLFWLR